MKKNAIISFSSTCLIRNVYIFEKLTKFALTYVSFRTVCLLIKILVFEFEPIFDFLTNFGPKIPTNEDFGKMKKTSRGILPDYRCAKFQPCRTNID